MHTNSFNLLILAGGKATRMGNICEEIPKSLLEINGKTILERQLDLVKNIHISETIIAAHHLASKFEPIALNRGLSIYVSASPEGTGGAIYNAMKKFKDKNLPTIVMNGDILLAENLTIMANNWSYYISDVMIMGTKVNSVADFGSLNISMMSEEVGEVKQFVEKTGIDSPGYINAGIYIILTSNYLHFEEERNKTGNWSVERDTFPAMIERKYVVDTYLTEAEWIDCGTPERLQRAKEIFK